MRVLIRYATAALIALGAGLTTSHPTARDAEAVDVGAPPAAGASVPVFEAPAPLLADAKDERSIAAALAAHGNPHDIQPGFFIDLIRSMEKSGLDRGGAYDVALALARNPNLDTIAGLTIAGSLPAYMAETGEALEKAVAELAGYLERPDAVAETVGERFGLLQPETEALIGDKTRSGNKVAAQRLIAEALLQRFNPALAAKILVPRSSPAQCCEVLPPAPASVSVARAVSPRALPPSRSTRPHRVLTSASKKSSAKQRRNASARKR